MKLKRKVNFWRLLEPLILGVLANFIINYIFNPSNPDSSLEEYVAAIFFSLLITELNHFIDQKLESKYNWTMDFMSLMSC